MKITFVGASHLSVCHAIIAQKFNHEINIVDFKNLRLKNLQNGKLDLKEPGVEDYLELNLISINSDFEKIKESNLIFLSLDVIVDSNGKSEIEELDLLAEEIINYLSPSSTLVIMSQVNPGYTRKLEKKVENIYYQMETLIFGNSLDRALNQDRIVIGKSKIETSLTNDYIKYLKHFNCPIFEMTFEEAEFTKQCANIFLAASISTTNSLAEICESDNLSWLRISEALRFDERIGKKAYLKPGLGIGGTNLIRDIINTIDKSEKKLNYSQYLKELFNSSNYHKNWIKNQLRNIKKQFEGKIHVGVLGITYKENIASIIGSGSYNALVEYEDYFVWKVYDPVFQLENNFEKFQCYNPSKIFENIDLLIIGNNDQRYNKIFLENIKNSPNLTYILDPYNVLYNIQINPNIKKLSIGEGDLN